MKLTQREIVLTIVEARHPEPVPSWDLQKTQTPWGWLGTSGDRNARRLAEDGYLERTMKGKYVYYSLPKVELDAVQLSFSDKLGSTMR